MNAELTMLYDVERVVVDRDKSKAEPAWIVEGVSLTCFSSFNSAVSSKKYIYIFLEFY